MIKDIVRIQYAETALSENWVFKDGSEDKKIPIIFSSFLICTDNRKILVDAGCETMSGFDMKNFKTPITALKEAGIEISDITDVIITHAHHDHIECAKYFKNATLYIQQDEYVKGKEYLMENQTIFTFLDEKWIDEDIKIVKIGGHTCGSSIVECKIKDKIYVICGDECYTSYNLKNKIPTGKSYSPQNSRFFIEKYSKSPYVCLLSHEL